MNKLHSAINHFVYTHPRFGISNLMRCVIVGNVIVYALYMFTQQNFSLLSFLTFDLHHLLQGELWRLITFIWVPSSFSPFSFLISLLFYYTIGNALERAWGSGKFTLYYLSGVVLSVLSTVLVSLISGNHFISLSNPYYLNMTLFLAFALLYPNAQVWLYFFPLKAKWIAWVDVALFAYHTFMNLIVGDVLGCLLPLVIMGNVIVFFWPEICDFLGYRYHRVRHQTSSQTVHFKSAVRQQKAKQAQQGYRHKCTVCGRTDTDFPDLEFRYCSRCAGYHCYCQDHITNHVHFSE